MTWMRSTGVLGTLAGFTLDGIVCLRRESADIVLHYTYVFVHRLVGSQMSRVHCTGGDTIIILYVFDYTCIC
ncbi:hypothetical protein F5Y00DRAFT_128966 [Daldinia vernicosa]|uniref:uncharacterized protein n=1 Tax=Daldinia vernicosa TaxID=114800 RepID=UPI002007413E|nr:uncharacterized protein F5Y00DRAFT_128966 [Daldinia vernicosa]KAI0846897.1 hypothetical protein F5Y00DRAFT_128966 [Daldinia vernicosa]